MGCSLVAGITIVGNTKNVRVDRTRRTWSAREEEILVATMKELAAKGWRGDNGYRAGYLTRIKEAIQIKYPNTDILPHPPHLLEDINLEEELRVTHDDA